MPAISKIRLTNVVYEHGQKRYHDEMFLFDGFNGAVVLENGGGKSVFIQTVLQAVIPHVTVGERHIKDTLNLDEGPAHIAIEWLLNERPRRYALTAVTLFKKLNGIDSLRYVYEYGENDPHSIENIPFVQEEGGEKRPSDRGEMADYYSYMTSQSRNAKTFSQSIKSYREYIEKEFHIIAGEWESIARINGAEGDVEAFFENCKKTPELIARLLIPSVEKAMAGFNKDVFAEIFENRREQFKKYKELKETIEQNKALSHELNFYVDRFRKVDEKEQAYRKARRHAKGYYTFLVEELASIITKLEQLEIAFQKWEDEQLLLSMKKDSLSIQKERELLAKKEEKEQELKALLADLEEDIQNSEHRKYSLQYAGYRDEILKERGNIEQYEQELNNLNREFDNEQLLLELDEVNGQIHYLFLEKKEAIEKQITETEWEINQLKREKFTFSEKMDELQRELKTSQVRLTATKTKAEVTSERMRSLKAELVSHADESVEQLFTEWTYRTQKLDEEIVMLKQKLKELTANISEHKNRRDQLQQQLLEKEKQLASEQQKKSQFDQEHDNILQLLTETLAQWTYVDNVYSRQTSIENQMEERLAKLKREKEKLLEEERQARRFVDDYMEQEHFFADPYVEKQIQHWNQFDYLITGIQYIDSIKEEISITEINYPFWALTLVTTEKEKTDVIEKLKSIQHHLKYPIYVISAPEAVELIKGEKTYDEVVEPSIWQINREQKHFTQWKEQIAHEAERKTLEREEVEERIKVWERTQEHFQQFLQKYPHTTYVEMTETIQNLSHDIQNIKVEQQKIVAKLIELENDYEWKQKDVHQKEIDFGHLQTKMTKAVSYMNLKKELAQLQQQITEYEIEARNLTEREKRLQQNMNDVDNRYREKRDELLNLKNALTYEIDKQELFQDVKRYRIIQTTQQMDSLKIRRNSLNDQLRQIQSSRSKWTSQIESSRQRITDLEKHQARLLNQYANLEKDWLFPINGEEQINQLDDHIRKLESDEKEASARWLRASNNRAAQKAKVDQLIEQYNSKYARKEVISFTMKLSTIAEQLKEEELALQQRRKFLTEQKERLEKERTNCLKAEQQFDKYELVHKLEDPKLVASVLTEEEKQQFPYQRLAIVEQLIHELENKQKAILVEREKLAQAKDDFKKFCNELRDPKMRKNAIEGVETKNTYEEIIHYQQLLEERIARTNQIAEITIQDYDKEQQQFITYIHTHLRKVRDDLLEIANKTRVKVRDGMEKIYQIQVPDWDEDVAKEKIRSHIDWILEKLELDQYRDESGNEDTVKIRQFLEKYLQTVPLLREVIGNETIKVKCRKVESGNDISNKFYTWEQSNQWSGGEKWSKNMALFLGLLNFIAEKSQHIQSNAKRHRTVILDNPFGKASSDHVLSPVFFIADQLGFQIIALTAHAEGKFLSDYFPIIYSCKLRHLEGGTKQVVTKERQIKVAYFQDHAPDSLVRLGEQEQLLLFE